MINIAELSSFVAAAEEMHFGRAAVRLNTTQPTLSRQIDALEHTLGVKLFERANRRVTLTAAGKIFLSEARRILMQLDNATNLARRTWRGEAGVLRLGFTATAALVDLPVILGKAAEALPDIRILLKESYSLIQRESLLADMLDVALLRPPVDRQVFDLLLLRQEQFVAALHGCDPRADKHRLALQDFDRLPFIMYSDDGAGYSFRILNAMFERANVNPDYVHHLDQNHSILSLVSAGLGAALVPDTLATLAIPNVVFRPIKIDRSEPLEMLLAWRSENRNPALAPFVAMCRKLFAQNMGTGSELRAQFGANQKMRISP